MAQRIAVGGEDFIALRRSDSYYVDKDVILFVRCYPDESL